MYHTTQKRKLHVVQSPESNPESPHSNSSEVFRLKIDRSKTRSLADLDKPGTSQLTQATVPVEIHRVVHFQDSSENEENSKSDPNKRKTCNQENEKTVESDKRKRPYTTRKTIMNTHRGEDSSESENEENNKSEPKKR